MSVLDSLTTQSTAHHSARAYPDAAAWLVERRTQDKAARTLDRDERVTAALLLAHPEHGLEDFTRDDLMAFFAKVTAPQRPVIRSHVNSFFKWAVFTDRLERNPMDKVPMFRKTRRKLKPEFTDVEVETLCAGKDGQLYRLLFDTGIRFNEARHLQVRHVDFAKRQVKVERGKGGKARVIPMTDRLTEVLGAWFKVDELSASDYLWGCRPGGGRLRRGALISESALRDWHQKRQAEADVPYRNFHATRHTMATYFLRRGISMAAVKDSLGHESIKTTMDLYSHLVVEDFAKELAALGL